MANHKPRDQWDKGRGYPRAYHHAMEIQNILFQCIQSPDTEPNVKANLARSYTVVEEMKRIITMRPAPKPIEVGHKPRQIVAAATFTEPEPILIADSPDSVSVVPAVEPPQNKKP